MRKANIIRERIDRSRRKGINGVLVFSDIVRPPYKIPSTGSTYISVPRTLHQIRARRRLDVGLVVGATDITRAKSGAARSRSSVDGAPIAVAGMCFSANSKLVR